MSQVNIDEVIDRFVEGVETCYSTDCLLVKLSSAVYTIEHISRSPTQRKTLLTALLSDLRVSRILARFYPYKDEIRERIETNVRFKNLRDYIDIILGAVERSVEAVESPKSISLVAKEPRAKR